MRTDVRRLAVAACTALSLTAAVPALVGAASTTVRVRDFTRRDLVRPRSLRFSEDGDLIASGLTWRHWGSAHAVGTGSFVFTEHPSLRQVVVRGTVTLTARHTCHAKRYYTRARVHAPGEPFKPVIAGLSPC